MKRLAALLAATGLAVALWPPAASAHAAPYTASLRCDNGTTVATVTWTNDTDLPAVIDIAGTTLDLPPLGTVSTELSITNPVGYFWRITWADGFTVPALTEPVPPIEFEPVEGCPAGREPATPCPERVNGPLCPPPLTYPPTTVVCPTWIENPPACTPEGGIVSPPPTSSEAVVLGSSQVIEAPAELAFTGSHSEALAILGVVCLVVGAAAVGVSVAKRSRP